jgi:hypothetical protein
MAAHATPGECATLQARNVQRTVSGPRCKPTTRDRHRAPRRATRARRRSFAMSSRAPPSCHTLRAPARGCAVPMRRRQPHGHAPHVWTWLHELVLIFLVRLLPLFMAYSMIDFAVRQPPAPHVLAAPQRLRQLIDAVRRPHTLVPLRATGRVAGRARVSRDSVAIPKEGVRGWRSPAPADGDAAQRGSVGC